MKRLLFFVFSLFATSCEEVDLEGNCPTCFKSIIRKNQPIEIWRYVYDNQTVYMSLPDCCDQYFKLYSSNCTYICAPSGGFTGDGDGKCADFNDKATNGVLVWKKK